MKKEAVFYLASRYSAGLFRLISKIIIARILGPKELGLWSFLAIFLIYGDLLHFGLVYALVKEGAFYKGRGDSVEANRVKDTVFTSLILITVIGSLAVFIFLFVFSPGLRLSSLAVPALIALILVLQQFENYFYYYFISENKFHVVSELLIFLASAAAILAVFLTVKLRLVGLLLGIGLGYLLVLPLMFYKYKPRIEFDIRMKGFFNLFKIGLSIMVIIMAYNIFLTIDRILIFRYLGQEDLGYYSIVTMLNASLVLFPASIGIMVFPFLSSQYGALKDMRRLVDFVDKPTIGTAYFMPVLAGLLYLLLSPFVVKFMPQYAPGIKAGQVALIGMVFFSISIFAQKFLIVINQQAKCLFVVLSAGAVKIGLIYLFLSRGAGIAGVAIAGNISYFIYSLLIIIIAEKYYKRKLSESLSHLFRIYLPFVYVLLILTIINNSGLLLNLSILVLLVAAPFAYIIKRRGLYSYKLEEWKLT